MQSDVTPINAPTAAPSTGGGSKDIEDFIYLISHDVRASVRALIELPQWIAEDLEDSGVHINGSVASSIELMNRHTGRLDRMLVDLLTFSRVGRMQDIEEVQLDDALTEVLDEMKVPAGFTVERRIKHPSVTLGNKDALNVLRALISNGIKHHDRDRGRVQVATYREGLNMVLSVCDDGPGIEEQFQDRVFSPMTTLRPRDEVEGSGMGLAVTKKVAVHYGGDARITPSPFGRGTQVEVRLPLQHHH